MIKISNIFIIMIFSALLISCSSYQLASYYDDSDGIYSSYEKGLDYEVVFKDFADESLSSYSSDELDSSNLPWGANPDSIEVVNNFFPSFGRFYYNPFYHNSAFNPFFSNVGSFINYGFRSPFFYNSYAYEMGYPFYGPMNFYFSPYTTSLGNYYWYMMRYSRNYPWYSRKEPSRVDFNNSASRRGEKNSSTNSSRKNDRQGVGISGIYSRVASYGGIYMDRTGDPEFERIDNKLIGVYSKANSSSRNISRNSSIPNLSSIKSDYVREGYRQVRSINPSQRGNSFNYSSARSRSNSYSPNQSQFNNSSVRSYSSPSRSSQGGNFSSSRSSGSIGGGGSKGGSAAGSRGGGKIN
jgi:hypothetical protein